VVLLATEREHHLAALADDLATDAAVVQHKPSARLPVVITRCRWSSAAAGDGVSAVGDVWRFDARRATPTERLASDGTLEGGERPARLVQQGSRSAPLLEHAYRESPVLATTVSWSATA
jgi:hypothetical protein